LFVLILHVPSFSFEGQKSFLTLFFQITLTCFFIVSFGTHYSQACVTIGLIILRCSREQTCLSLVLFAWLTDYWSRAEHFHTTFYTNAMKQDRFLHILQFLHFTDNNNEPDMTDLNSDRLWKMRNRFEIFKILQPF
jgi:hypothetical protein